MAHKRSTSLQVLLNPNNPVALLNSSLSPAVQTSTQKYAPKLVITETEALSSPGDEPLPSKSSSPLIRFESDASTLNMKKLVLTGDDEFLDQALIKLESIMKKQMQKSERKDSPGKPKNLEKVTTEKGKDNKEGGKTESSSSPAPNTRNQDIIQRITKYKSVKGINPRTKEVRFEDRLNTFKEVKTFVDIKQLVKDIGSPEKSLSPKRKYSESPDFRRQGSDANAIKELVPLNLDGSGYSNLLHPTGRDEPQPVYLAPVFGGKSILGKVDESMNGGILDSFAIERLQEAKSKEARKKERLHRRIEQAYVDLKNQVVKHMGPDIFEEMKKKKSTLESRTLKEMTLQSKIELYNIRQAQRNLKNFDMFNSVMNHLSAVEADVGEPLVRKDEGPEEFYQQMEKTIFADDETEVNDEITMAMERFDEEPEEVEIEVKPRDSKTITLKGVPESLWQDEQVRMINAVQEYKKRSDRVIHMLKNRTKRIHIDEKKVKQEIKDAKAQLNGILTPAFSETGKSPSNFTKAFDESQLPRIDEYIPKGLEPIREVSVQTPMSHNISFLGGFEKIRAKSSFGKQPVIESPTNLNFYKNVMENKKKYMEMKDKGLGSPQFASRGRIIWAKEDERRFVQPVKTTKAQKLKYSYTASVNKLNNDVSGLLAVNKSLGTEIKMTLEETDKFYDTKAQSFNVKNIPEALKLPKKGPSFSKRAHLIMDLTRDLLKNKKKSEC